MFRTCWWFIHSACYFPPCEHQLTYVEIPVTSDNQALIKATIDASSTMQTEYAQIKHSRILCGFPFKTYKNMQLNYTLPWTKCKQYFPIIPWQAQQPVEWKLIMRKLTSIVWQAPYSLSTIAFFIAAACRDFSPHYSRWAESYAVLPRSYANSHAGFPMLNPNQKIFAHNKARWSTSCRHSWRWRRWMEKRFILRLTFAPVVSPSRRHGCNNL